MIRDEESEMKSQKCNQCNALEDLKVLEILLEILCWMLLENLLEIETTTVKLREIKETVEKTVGSHEGVDG